LLPLNASEEDPRNNVLRKSSITKKISSQISFLSEYCLPISNNKRRLVRSLALNLLVAGISLVAFVAVLESAARLKYSPQKIHYRWIFEYDKDKGNRLKPNTSGRFAGISVQTNSSGYRDSEIPLSKGSRTKRILVVGDSVTFGHGVSAADTYPEFLERRLNEEKLDLSFEVINTAVPGNSPFQEYYDLKKGLAYSPDLIVIQFTLNDVVEPYWVFKRFGGPGNDFHEVEDINYYHYLLSQYSGLYLLLRDVYAKLRFRNIPGASIQEKASQFELYTVESLISPVLPQHISEAWDECMKWEQAMVDLAKKNDLPVILVVTPFAFQMLSPMPSRTEPQERMRKFAEKNGLVYVDLLKLMEDELIASIREHHVNAAQGSPAEILSEFLVSHREIMESFWYSLFLDQDHLARLGHWYVAARLHPLVKGLLPSGACSYGK
jgi:hypothetical protein